MSGNDSAGRRTTALTLAVLVAASTISAVPGLVLFVQPAAANAPTTIAVTQGPNCYNVQPVGDGSRTVEEFYDYRTPETDPSSRTYSSFGTEDYQETGVSSMFFYEGSDGTSLVVVHDRTGDGDGGSTVSWSISGLPADGEMAVQDDYYQSGTQDDSFGYSDGDESANIDWMWAENRTDGAALRGLESDDFGTITIDPAYNEEAEQWGEWSRSGEGYRMDAWKLKEEGGETVGELSLDGVVSISPGPCDQGTGPTADIDAPDTTGTGEEITFDGSGSTPADGITDYRWEFDDGASATGASVKHSYDEPGTYAVTLTVEDDDGNTNTTSTRVEVTGGDGPPTASFTAPANATVNESVEFDARGSTDDDGIREYRWDFDGDGTVDRATDASVIQHPFDTAGEVTVTLTVVDTANATDSATATLTVEEAETNEPPTASLSAPDSAAVNESVRLDASGSADDDGIREYRWDFDGDGTVDRTTNASATDHAFDTAGETTVSVTVVDTANATGTATATVTVAAENDSDTPGSGGPPGDGNGNDGGDNDDDGNNGVPPSGGGGGGGGGGGQPAPDPEPAYELSAVNATTTDLLVGENATFSMTVTNTGDGAGTKDVEFEVDGTTVTTETVRLAAGENETVTFTHRFTEPGTHTVELDTSGRTDVRVRPREPDLSVVDVWASEGAVTTNEPVRVNATVRNAGHAEGSMELQLEMFGEVVDVETVSVPPGERRTVSFTRQVNAPGTYTASVAGRNVTFEVREADGDRTAAAGTTERTERTETTTPGFTAVVAVIALLACAAAAAAHRDR